MMREYGLQMYGIRDLAKVDFRKALKTVAELGYQAVEFAGFFNYSATDVKNILAEYGLHCWGTHTPISALQPNVIEETVRYHKELGCNSLTVPGGYWKTEEEMNYTIALLNLAKATLDANGIALSYHNHSGEFMRTPYGKIVEEEILNRTDVRLEVDTFWAWNAGLDPISFLSDHKDRIDWIHLKDGVPTTPENRTFASVHKDVIGKALGEGNAPVKAVREWAIQNRIPMIVESEGLTPSGAEEVGRCIDYLRKLEA